MLWTGGCKNGRLWTPLDKSSLGDAAAGCPLARRVQNNYARGGRSNA